MKTPKTLILLVLVILFAGCDKNPFKKSDPEISDNMRLNEYLYEIFIGQSWYYWYEEVPEIAPDSIWDSKEYFNRLRYPAVDKWSYMTSKEAYHQYYEQGTYYGLGFSYAWDEAMNLRVSYVFADSPMSDAGISRGFRILEIDGKPISYLMNNGMLGSSFGPSEEGYSVTMKMENRDGKVAAYTVKKREVYQNSVLHRNVHEVNGQKIGYMLLKTFIEPTRDELADAFAFFKAENVSNFVLDLRYNGGGRLDVSNLLINLLAGNSRVGVQMLTIEHNETKSDQDEKYFFDEATNGLDVKKLVVLTSQQTASASEAVINCLSPYIEVVTVGDKTHGKPVGMYLFEDEGIDMVIVPITFKLSNVNGEGEYYDGIPVNAFAYDNYTTPFGDPNEPLLKEALYYLEHGSFSGTLAKKSFMPVYNLKGLQGEINAF